MARDATLHYVEQYPSMPTPLLDREVTLRRGPLFFDEQQSRTLEALCDRVLPQATPRVAVPLAALLDARCYANLDEGSAPGQLAPRDTWRLALGALDSEARERYGKGFADLRGTEQDALVHAMRSGLLGHPAWGKVAPQVFFHQRLLRDVSTVYYSHPAAWPSASIVGSFAFPAGPCQE
ncbi:gluconate 2-dehydrogenase subunit 3 family protein [Pseudomonas typographi]|uniref:Gluconate 2-dehydrogenase subunit 3 family protein n=1 Tax=Pseudomonas typographi TaxID=2715964 RepID=A0ABR7Z4G0_9PSED|nr:gluconate 2-dehydrogenase subunit 3 family protein [Pseudomonas typographi]MBD1588056.1 gluconate 2-dehydrogenase subunit 3 family protein [Pseudomonas typographi]MBD1600391.1 gluconate 2-dehydrogenase subunit 3 family protein [Pseudomonas typographi]